MGDNIVSDRPLQGTPGDHARLEARFQSSAPPLPRCGGYRLAVRAPLVDRARHVDALWEPTPVEPSDRVPDLESCVLNGAGKAVPRPSPPERQHEPPRLEDAQRFTCPLFTPLLERPRVPPGAAVPAGLHRGAPVAAVRAASAFGSRLAAVEALLGAARDVRAVPGLTHEPDPVWRIRDNRVHGPARQAAQYLNAVPVMHGHRIKQACAHDSSSLMRAPTRRSTTSSRSHIL